MNGFFSNYSHQDLDVGRSIVMQHQVPGAYMNPEQTFHTPSFGDEEFDIPPLSLPNSGTLASEGLSGNVAYHSQNTAPSQTIQLSGPQQQHMISIAMPTSGKEMEGADYHHHQQQQQQQQTIYVNAESVDGLTMGTSTYTIPVASCPTVYLTNDHQQQMGISTAGPTSLLSTISQSQLSSQLRLQFNMRNQTSGSPPCSNQTSPGLETSEDSDDSATLGQTMGLAMKRPSPDLIPGAAVGKAATNKKVKLPKKKKKRDPNEPQKPVSAYALFFRDTQAAIKGQNPNASFGEVSKIVASMWDSLDEDHKNVYKKRTESAKKDYLKALAAYRASLVSKGCETSDLSYGNSSPIGMPPSFSTHGSSSQIIMPSSYYNTSSSAIGATAQELSPLQKKSPLLTSLMENSASSTSSPAEREVTHIQPMQTTHILSGASSLMQTSNAPQQQQLVLAVANNQFHTPATGKPRQMSQMQFNLQQSQPEAPSHTYTTLMAPSNSVQTGTQEMASGQQHAMSMEQHGTCLRNGCPNPAIESPEWDNEYCSNDCVGRVYGMGSFSTDSQQFSFSQMNDYRSSVYTALW